MHDRILKPYTQHAKTLAPPARPRPPRPRPRKPTPLERTRAFYAALTINRIIITPEVCATLQVLLAAQATDPDGISVTQISIRSGTSRHTTYPILARLAAARWITRQPEDPQARRNRAGPGKGGPRRTCYSLTSDGRTAALRELALRTTKIENTCEISPGEERNLPLGTARDMSAVILPGSR